MFMEVYQMILQISEIQNKDNTIEVVCSTSKPDLKGDRIYIQGLGFTRYMKNPVFLLEHTTLAAVYFLLPYC